MLHPKDDSSTHELFGLAYGFLGIVIFSLTLPATRVAVTSLDPAFVGLGRSLLAAVMALAVLSFTRQPIPARCHWPSLFIVALGVVIGFPLLSAFAMKQLPAAHAAVINGLLPMMTALVATFRGGERPSWQFWGASLLGSSAVIAFAIWSGAGQIQSADWILLGAGAAAAVGYAEGGKLGRVMGGWQVICWALLIAAPFLAWPTVLAIARNASVISPESWLGFLYVSFGSQLLGFFAWFKGLSLGGVARVGQVQLMQPFLTLFFSALLLGEEVSPATIGFALCVILAVALSKRATVKTAPAS